MDINGKILQGLTDEQKNAVLSRNGTLLLSASAGSGKTSVLTRRVIHRIMCGDPIDADRLLIVTFSRLAAEEMRQRISREINELIKEFPENERLAKQQILLYKTQISTISSFCLKLVKENFSRAGVSPDFRIAEDAELSILSDIAINEVFDEQYERGDNEFLSLVEYFYKKNDKLLADIVCKLYEFTRSYPFPADWLNEKLEIYKNNGTSKTDKCISFLIYHIKSNLEYILEFNALGLEILKANPVVETAYRNAFLTDGEKIREILKLCADKNWDGVYYALCNLKYEKLSPLRGLSGDETKERASSLRQSVKDRMKKLLKIVVCPISDMNEEIKEQEPLISCLFKLVKTYEKKFDELKKEKNILTFSDIEHLAVKLLIVKNGNKYEKSSLCTEITGEFDEIMVDEFQDTNRTQELIFDAISKNGENIFMVGDVKQSIYSFRKAMPDIFIEKRENFFEYDGINYPAFILLSKNFRSRKEVTGSVNFILRQLMSKKTGGTDYGGKEELITAAKFQESANQSFDTEIHFIDASEQNSEESGILAEAKHIGLQIRKMVAGGFKVTGKNGLRPCSFGDFAILLRTTKEKADIYVKELTALDVPSISDKSTGYFNSREIVLMMNLLRIIDNPLLDIPFLSVLLSPIGDFTAEEVSIMRITEKKLPFYLCMLNLIKNKHGREHINEKCRQFIEMLDRLRKECNVIPVDIFIQKIYDETLFSSIAGAMEPGGKKQANLRLLVKYAVKYEAAGFKGISGFLRFTDKLMENGTDFESANTYNNTDSVRIMSIHKSKGLEFPVCFVADCSKGFNLTELNKNILFNSDFGVAMKFQNRKKLLKYDTIPLIAARIKEKQSILSEEMRILYVAATRAKDKLIFTMNSGDIKNLADNLSCIIPHNSIEFHHCEVMSQNSYMKWILAASFRNKYFDSFRKTGTEMKIKDIKCFSNELGENSDINLHFKLFNPLAGDEKKKEQAPLFTGVPDEELMKKIELNISYKYPYKLASETPAKVSATDLAARNEKIRDNIYINEKRKNIQFVIRRPEFIKKEGLSPAEKGVALHTFMQFMDFSEAKKDLRRHLRELLEKEYLTKEEADSIDIKSVSNFLNSDLMKRIEKAKILREFKFMDEIPAEQIAPSEYVKQMNFTPISKENDMVLVQGIADLILIEEDGFSVVDYKTDKINEEKHIENYRSQLEFYGGALGKIFDIQLKDLIIYSLHLSKIILIN